MNKTTRARTFWTGVMLCWMLLAGIADALATEAQYNPAGSPLPLAQMELAVEYAAEFAWSSRINVGAEYTGLTGDTLADGKIIVRWESAVPVATLVADEPGLEAHREDIGFRLAFAQWWTRTSDGSLVKAEIVLGKPFFADTVDRCDLEVLVHEFGHVFRLAAGHSDQPEDVMYPTRGTCRYSPSLSDLAFVGRGRPLLSCHVERTPHGDLEYLDHQGIRYQLTPQGANQWALGATYTNPAPQYCDGIHVAGGEVWAEVWAFHAAPVVLRLVREKGMFVSTGYAAGRD